MTLTHPTPFNNDVRKVMFIKGCPLMVAITDSTIFVWNLVARNLWWSYSARTVHAAADPSSSLFAVTVFVAPPKKFRRFASALRGGGFQDSSVHFILIFDARNPKPQAVMRLHTPAVALAFVPPANGKGPSSLVYMNENNELITLERGVAPSSASAIAEEKSDKLPEQQPTEFESAFNAVVEGAGDKKKSKDALPEVTSVAPKNEFSKLFEGPSHTLPALEGMLPALFERLMLKEEPEDENKVDTKMEEDKNDETKGDESVATTGMAADDGEMNIPREWIDEECGTDLYTYNTASYDWAVHTFDAPRVKPAVTKRNRQSSAVTATPKASKTPRKSAMKTKTPRHK